ncbi:sulfate transporter [Microbacterium mangrovi]|uniref:Sulfate transporter n=1 Tax=Microbacterium mangrovi TaxID=1348253 RepID=A0A0B2A0R0_9MICO|nr:SulP family inorganic anion transporter [Microbacterium mangrovi]KHK96606.1 sulfate transporter [Microbacterium mangrovi]
MTFPKILTPVSLRGYRRAWLGRDLIAGVTLTAVAIPEVMGYTSISQTPIVTGLYTILLPLLAFALFGASKLLVVGGDSATAAILAGGLIAAGIPGLTPGSPKWVALCGLTALVCGLLLIVARIARLGFIGDFLSASVLIGFLTGVGIQVATGQIPDILGVPKGSGNWFQQQWAWISSLGDISWPTFAYGAITVAVIYAFKFMLPKVPGAIIAVIGLLIVATATNAPSYGVKVVGAIQGGFPPIGFPAGVSWTDVPAVISTAFACFVIIISQSAATSRSFAMKHGDRADVNRDIVGLAAANLAAGLSGTFVVNGSPTKTQILDGQKGRTQVANLVVVALTLVVLLFFAGLLTDLPKAVLGGVVFVIGVELIDIKGLVRVSRQRRREFWIALITALTVFIVGVGAGVIAAVVLSLIDVIERQYKAREFVLGVRGPDGYTYDSAADGSQSEPGLIVFRYDAELFYANASRFVDEVQELVDTAAEPVEWVILDAAGISDIDYSAGQDLVGLFDYLSKKQVTLVLARPDAAVLQALTAYGLRERLPYGTVFNDLDTAVHAYRTRDAAPNV